MSKIFGSFSILAALAVAGCAGSQQVTELQPSPLTPAPVGQVTSNSLPPVGATPTQPEPVQPSTAQGQDLQAIPTLPSSGGASGGGDVTVSPDIEFGRNAVLGAWRVASQADNCNLNLSLTTWNGGFRASTRRCTNETLTGIGAWQLAGKQLTLRNSTGGVIARLVASGDNRFDGTTESGGAAISVFR